MIFLTQPEPYAIRSFLDNQVAQPFSYPEVGATNADLPQGYAINHTRRQIGRGQAVYQSACEALKSWQQLRLGWVDCWPHNAPLKAGEQIAVIGKAFGCWWLNACRVAYTINESGREPKFGYAHGTLPAHLATGEERFLIEMLADEGVWLDILAFSRPNTTLAKLGYPLMRRAQRKFGKESSRKVLEIVSANRTTVDELSPSIRHSRSKAIAAE